MWRVHIPVFHTVIRCFHLSLRCPFLFLANTHLCFTFSLHSLFCHEPNCRPSFQRTKTDSRLTDCHTSYKYWEGKKLVLMCWYDGMTICCCSRSCGLRTDVAAIAFLCHLSRGEKESFSPVCFHLRDLRILPVIE